MSSGIPMRALSVVGSDHTWKSPSRVLTCWIGAISRADSRPHAPEFVNDDTIGRLIGHGDLKLVPARLELPRGRSNSGRGASLARCERKAQRREGATERARMTAIPSWMARGDKVMPRMIGMDAPFPPPFPGRSLHGR